MRVLSRYILLELFRVFLVTMVGMTTLILLAGVAQEAIRQGLGLVPILRLIPYFLPHALVFAVPGTILFATCSVYGRMSADNELVAAKSLGISPAAFLTPGLILAFLVSMAAVWLNDVAASWGQQGIHRVVLQSVEQIAYGMLRTQRSYSTRQFAINVMDVRGRKLVRPTLTFHSSDDSHPFTLTAEEAELRLNPVKNTLSIVVTNSDIDWGDNGGHWPGQAVQEIPLTAAAQKGGHVDNPSDCAMHEVAERLAVQRQTIQQLQQQAASRAAVQMISGNFPSLTAADWSHTHALIVDAKNHMFKLHLVPWRRWANGFSCLFFVLVGAPLAIRLRNADIWTSFGLCFLPILLVYYPLLMYGLDRAKCGALPPYSVWLGNLVLAAVGSWLVYKVMKR